MSLRAFHIVFIAIVIAGADLFGAWTIRDFQSSHSLAMLVMGIVAIAVGLGLIPYGIWFVRKLDRANIH